MGSVKQVNEVHRPCHAPFALGLLIMDQIGTPGDGNRLGLTGP